jgi:hypothetical protein
MSKSDGTMKTSIAGILSIVLCLAMLGGCASPATHQAMTVQPQPGSVLNPKLKGAIRIDKVTGGKETNPMWMSQVDNDSFAKALENSLAIAGYLVPGTTNAPYALSADLKELNQPLIGLTFDVKSSVLYKLTGPDRGKEFAVNATGTATPSDAFVALERGRIASERSILENIKALLKELERF